MASGGFWKGPGVMLMGMNREAGSQKAPEGRDVAQLSLCLPLPTGSL